MKQLEFILAGAETLRWHTTPTLKEQSVAAHSFHVAWLCYTIMGPHVRPHLLLAALAHDLAEHQVGDMPAPAKRGMEQRIPGFREQWEAMELDALGDVGLNFKQHLTPNEKRVLKLADVCECALYVIRERRLGNQTMRAVMERISNYIDDVFDISQPRECELKAYIVERWIEANNGDYRGR